MFYLAIRKTRPISRENCDWNFPTAKAPHLTSLFEPTYFTKAHSSKRRWVCELTELLVGITLIILAALGSIGMLPIGLSGAIACGAIGLILTVDGSAAFILDLVRSQNKARYREIFDAMKGDNKYKNKYLCSEARYMYNQTLYSIKFSKTRSNRVYAHQFNLTKEPNATICSSTLKWITS